MGTVDEQRRQGGGAGGNSSNTGKRKQEEMRRDWGCLCLRTLTERDGYKEEPIKR